MAVVYKWSTIFQLNTVATNVTVAVNRIGGWSEGLWTQNNPTASFPLWTTYMLDRAKLLPAQGAIVGYRISSYNLAGNKLSPIGSSAGKVLYPGNPAYPCDIPQMALELGLTSALGPNAGKLWIRAIPDQFIVTGEFAPSTGFTLALFKFMSNLVGTTDGWVGRNLSVPTMRVQGYAANVISVDAVPGGVVAGAYVRFYRCNDNNGVPIKGSFLIVSVTANTITISNGPTQTLSRPSGLCRQDLLQFLTVLTWNYGSVSPKKVGAPSRRYRGRRSKVRA
jgi:hypothetical protein